MSPGTSTRGAGPTDALRGRILAVYAILGAFNILAWGFCLTAFHARPALLRAAVSTVGLSLSASAA